MQEQRTEWANWAEQGMDCVNMKGVRNATDGLSSIQLPILLRLVIVQFCQAHSFGNSASVWVKCVCFANCHPSPISLPFVPHHLLSGTGTRCCSANLKFTHINKYRQQHMSEHSHMQTAFLAIVLLVSPMYSVPTSPQCTWQHQICVNADQVSYLSNR